MTHSLVNIDDYEKAARDRVPHAAWEYIQSGAGDELTVRWNREAYDAIRLSARVLSNVANPDTRIKLLGKDLAHPIFLGPVAAHGLVHAQAEIATAMGARDSQAGMVLSTYTSTPIEHIITVDPPLLWFQLYMQERGYTRELIPKMTGAGCTALVITVDTPTGGARHRQARAGFDWPGDLPYRSVKPGENPCTWVDVAWIREMAKVPVILKGIMHPEDAELAIQAGAAAIVVSNHGGRNLDTLPATVELLPRIVDRVHGRVPIFIDGGIRRGTDILKALALGANAVMIGRPYIYGLAVGGGKGVTSVVNILRSELQLAMALTGRPNIASVDRSVIWMQ